MMQITPGCHRSSQVVSCNHLSRAFWTSRILFDGNKKNCVYHIDFCWCFYCWSVPILFSGNEMELAIDPTNFILPCEFGRPVFNKRCQFHVWCNWLSSVSALLMLPFSCLSDRHLIHLQVTSDSTRNWCIRNSNQYCCHGSW